MKKNFSFTYKFLLNDSANMIKVSFECSKDSVYLDILCSGRAEWSLSPTTLAYGNYNSINKASMFRVSIRLIIDTLINKNILPSEAKQYKIYEQNAVIVLGKNSPDIIKTVFKPDSLRPNPCLIIINKDDSIETVIDIIDEYLVSVFYTIGELLPIEDRNNVEEKE